MTMFALAKAAKFTISHYNMHNSFNYMIQIYFVFFCGVIYVRSGYVTYK